RFDGMRFIRSTSDANSEENLPLPPDDRWYRSATFTIRGLTSEELPSEQGTTVGVNYDGSLRHDGDGTTRTVGTNLHRGATYTVMSYVPNPTPAQLRMAPRAFPAIYLRYTDFDLPAPGQSGLRLAATNPPQARRFSTDRTVGSQAPGLPPARDAQRRILASPYGPMYRLARQLAGRSHSSYDVALAIERYLKENAIYMERIPLRRYPLESFLFADHAGYCQQFSGAMALMLRMDGIPARVAAGFRPGSYDGATGVYDVRAVDAHSWVEVFFSGIGWVPFDPTPPRAAGRVLVGQRYPSERTAIPVQAIEATVGSLPQYAGERIPTVPRPKRGGSRAAVVALLIVALACLAGLAALTVRWLAGRARLRRSLEGDGELAAAELVHAMRRLGYSIPPTVTLTQIEHLVRVQGGAEAARYVRGLRERRYAASNGTAVTLRDRRVLRRALTAHLGLDARVRGLWALPPATASWRVQRRTRLAPNATSQASAAANRRPSSRAASCTPPIAIAGQPRKLKTRVYAENAILISSSSTSPGGISRTPKVGATNSSTGTPAICRHRGRAARPPPLASPGPPAAPRTRPRARRAPAPARWGRAVAWQ
ncbi:MAG: transglutaminase domain-containing protein, partial [Actinobacteria bacterium]